MDAPGAGRRKDRVTTCVVVVQRGRCSGDASSGIKKRRRDRKVPDMTGCGGAVEEGRLCNARRGGPVAVAGEDNEQQRRRRRRRFWSRADPEDHACDARFDQNSSNSGRLSSCLRTSALARAFLLPELPSPALWPLRPQHPLLHNQHLPLSPDCS